MQPILIQITINAANILQTNTNGRYYSSEEVDPEVDAFHQDFLV